MDATEIAKVVGCNPFRGLDAYREDKDKADHARQRPVLYSDTVAPPESQLNAQIWPLAAFRAGAQGPKAAPCAWLRI